MSLPRDEILRLQPDDVVTITIRHAQVNWVDDNEINISFPGLDEDTWNIPLTNFDGVPLHPHLVSVERAATCTGCGRVIPLSEAMVGLTTCEHCPTASPTLDLSTLGQDYEPDPAKRIAAIAAEFPEFVVRGPVDGGERP